ncbi:autotransporter domain-containing protein, partial [bacterium]|nr:autotransporter domain-containing protein [bacterium]
PGTYTFTYIPLGNPLSYDPNGTPTMDWHPQDNVILSSDVTLTAAIISPPGSYSGPGLADTIASITSSAYDLYNAYQHRLATTMLGLTSYDCETFGSHGFCASIAAKSSTSVGDGSDFAGVATFAWRPLDYVKVGAFIEQQTTAPSFGSVTFRSHEPTVGAYITLQERIDAEGLKLRLAYAQSRDELRISRSALGTAEAGTGTSSMKTSGYGAELSYGIGLSHGWVVSPYVGAWQLKTERAGYTETDVSYPITFGAATLEHVTITYGARLIGEPLPNLRTTFGMGMESDISTKQSAATGTSSILGLENFSASLPSVSGSTRAVASATVAYNIGNNQAIGGSIVARHTPKVEGYMQQDATNITALVKYSIGF